VVLLVLHRFPRRVSFLRAGRSLHSLFAVLVIASVEVGDMITLAIFACRFLIVLGIGAVWGLLAIAAGKFCAFNDSPP